MVRSLRPPSASRGPGLRGQALVDSTSKCTVEGFVDDLEGCSVAEALARPIIERVDNEGKFVIADLREVGAFGEVASQQSIGILVGPALPGAVRIGEEHPQPGGLFDLFEGGELLAVIERKRAAPALGQRG